MGQRLGVDVQGDDIANKELRRVESCFIGAEFGPAWEQGWSRSGPERRNDDAAYMLR